MIAVLLAFAAAVAVSCAAALLVAAAIRHADRPSDYWVA